MALPRLIKRNPQATRETRPAWLPFGKETESVDEIVQKFKEKGEPPEIVDAVRKLLSFCKDIGGKVYFYEKGGRYIAGCHTEMGARLRGWIETRRKYIEIGIEDAKGREVRFKFDRSRVSPIYLRTGIVYEDNPFETDTYYPYADIETGDVGPYARPTFNHIQLVSHRKNWYELRLVHTEWWKRFIR